MSDERFLSRWMRRKAAARQADVTSPAPQPEPPAEAAMQPPAPVDTPDAEHNTQRSELDAPEATQPVDLPDLDSLQGLASDYEAFMRAEVDPQTRQAALRKLFSDPHFNEMDGLDIYIDDYGQPDPIPPAMLAGLEQARSLLWGDKETDEESETVEAPESLALPEERPSEPVPTELSQKNEELSASEEGGDEAAGGDKKAI